MGVGFGKGDTRAQDAVKQAISSPLLETSIDGATDVIINFTGGADLGALEVYDAADVVREAVDPAVHEVRHVMRYAPMMKGCQ